MISPGSPRWLGGEAGGFYSRHMTYRLTIGIPTHNRPEMLARAIDSALAQTTPAQIVITDDGNADITAALLAGRYPDQMASGQIRHIPTGPIGLWPNWDAVARACSTEFFLWLQDDDVLMEYVAARVIAAFDSFPEADTWIAQNKIALDGDHIWWNNGNGPWVPLNRHGRPDQWEAEVLVPTSYFLAWSLSPAVAFRTGARFAAMLDGMPDIPIFAERLVLAGMGGRFIADPCVAGLWIQHAKNTSREMRDDQPRQTRILIRHLDQMMDAMEPARWREILDLWARLQHPEWIVGWIENLEHAQREGGKSRYGQAIRDVLAGSLHGRVRFVPRYKWWYKPIAWLRDKAAF